MNSLRCSNCSLLNFADATVCKRCGLPFDSPAGNEWESHPYASYETYPPPGEPDPNLWDRPSYRPSYVRPPVRSSSPASKLVVVAITIAVTFLVAFLAIPALLKSKKVDLSKLSWTEYRSPDGKFSVSLPVTPRERTLSSPTPFGTVQVHSVEADVTRDGGCMLVYADYQVERMNVSEETLYEMAIQGTMSRQNVLAVGSRRYITVDGYRGVEVELTPKDSKESMKAVCRIFWIPPRLYALAAGGPETPEYKTIQTRCLETFHLYRGC